MLSSLIWNGLDLLKLLIQGVNRLFLNALWGQKGNFLDVPTDCPQRDERMGWTGDAQAFWRHRLFQYGFRSLLHKISARHCFWNRLLMAAAFHMLSPVIKKNGENSVGKDSCAWADAAVIIPWTVYVMCGDKDLLEQQYPSMKMWTEKMMSYDEAGWRKTFMADRLPFCRLVGAG